MQQVKGEALKVPRTTGAANSRGQELQEGRELHVLRKTGRRTHGAKSTRDRELKVKRKAGAENSR